MESDSPIDDASKAYAALSAQLESWTSPNVGKLSSNWRTYEEDALHWLETTVGRDAEAHPMDTTQTAKFTPFKTPQKRPEPPESSLPSTPVMSNSGKKSDRHPSPLNLMKAPEPQVLTFANDEYKLYHDALFRFVQARGVIQKKLDLGAIQILGKEDLAADIDYLQTLALDHHLWSLLVKLRNLGLEALWMNDSSVAQQRMQIAIYDALTRLSHSTLTTHTRLLNNLYGETSPLLVLRRKALMEWLEEYTAQTTVVSLPTKTDMWPETTKLLQQGKLDKLRDLHPDVPLLVPEGGLADKDVQADEKLLQACLDYIRAGRMEKAIELCRKHGQPWRSAIWKGGQPHDIASYPHDKTQTLVNVTTGNPNRFLWKCQVRKLTTKTKGTEAAIYALLSNNLNTALANPAFRTWEDGLYVCVSCVVARMEDEVLHRYHTHLRKTQRVFPGSNQEQQEMEHLLATATATSMNEVGIFDRLEASPFVEFKSINLMQKLMAAFIQGRSAVQTFLSSPWFRDQNDEVVLRTMTHILVYLDILASTPESIVVVDGLCSMKEDCLLQYLRHLASRPDLVRFTVVYASLLPLDIMLEVYPGLLTSVQVPEERRLLWDQMKTLLDEDVDVMIITRIVRLVLGDADLSDVRKCQSIGWLCLSPDHYDEALTCANALVRQLLLNDKTYVANEFLWDYFPKTVQDDRKGGCISDRREHDALQMYLEANDAFERWKECISVTPPETLRKTLDLSKLNRAEQDIARSMEKRTMVQGKKETAQKVVSFAHAAQSKLEEVLSFDGGWLKEYEDDDDVESQEEIDRKKELEKLQARLIPQVVFSAHTVYSETATWMKSMLEDAIPVVGKNTNEVLKVLDDIEDCNASPLSPMCWLRSAHSLADKVASEEYGVYDSFGREEMKRFLSLMEETTIRVLEEGAVERTK